MLHFFSELKSDVLEPNRTLSPQAVHTPILVAPKMATSRDGAKIPLIIHIVGYAIKNDSNTSKANATSVFISNPPK